MEDGRERSGAGDLALVLGGGGARAAYQAGFLRGLGRAWPELRFPVVTGISAGAINAVHLAAHRGPLAAAAGDLVDLWSALSIDRVFRVDTACLARNLLRWAVRLVSGGSALAPQVRGLVDTGPLDDFLRRVLPARDGEIAGIGDNLERGVLRAFALSTLDYATGRTVTWVQGRDITTWERPHRRSRQARITVDHVMASAALPLLFPAVELDGSWYGDGGVRQSAPLSPALHLGASRILTVSTRYPRTFAEADRAATRGYPPPAQVLGNLLNAIFLDVVDQDALRLERLNLLLRELPEEKRHGLKPIDLLVIRPSQDLGRLVSGYEGELPRGFRFLTRSLGTRETASPDFLSLVMFQPEYLRRLIEIGEADAEARREEIAALLQSSAPP
jgi:NTE family protein